jgi:hypothetical protein
VRSGGIGVAETPSAKAPPNEVEEAPAVNPAAFRVRNVRMTLNGMAAA